MTKNLEESRAAEQRELMRFLKALLDVVETMMRLNERGGSDQHRRAAREYAIRALEIIARFTPHVRDKTLVHRIRTFVAYYATMLEGKEM